jgi:signal transduction histidine kinase
LLSVTQALAGAVEQRQVAEVILQRGLVAAGAVGGAVALTRDSELEVLSFVGASAEAVGVPLTRISMEAPAPIAYAARTGQPLFFRGPDEWRERFHGLPGVGAWAGVPMIMEDRCIGVLTASFDGERELSHGLRDFLTALGSQCALAMHRAQLFEAERTARAAAEEAVRTREEFLSIASHELRTPLTPLFLQLGAMRRMADASWAVRLDTALRQTERLSRLITNLLDVGRIGTGRFQLDREELDLEPLVRGVVDRCAEELRRAACDVTQQTEPVRVSADVLRLEQVVLNLISNAIKYAAGTPLSVKLARDGDHAVLVVRDQGIGIPPGSHGRIFDRFERAVPNKEYTGLGLGLYIARQIIEAHGGAISVDSEAGKGAAFTVRLPLAP